MKRLSCVPAILLCLEAAPATAGPLAARSRETIVIRVTVAPRAWVSESGAVCLNLPSEAYRVAGDWSEDHVAWPEQGCGVHARSQLRRMPLKPQAGTLIISPE